MLLLKTKKALAGCCRTSIFLCWRIANRFCSSFQGFIAINLRSVSTYLVFFLCFACYFFILYLIFWFFAVLLNNFFYEQKTISSSWLYVFLEAIRCYFPLTLVGVCETSSGLRFVLWTRCHRTVSHNILLVLFFAECTEGVFNVDGSLKQFYLIHRVKYAIAGAAGADLFTCWSFLSTDNQVDMSVRTDVTVKLRCERESNLILFWSWIIAFLWHEAKRNKNNLVCCKSSLFFFFFL